MPAPDTNARQVLKIRSGQVRELPTVGKIVAHMPVAVEREEGKRRNESGSHPLKTPKNYANFLEFLTHLYYLLFFLFLGLLLFYSRRVEKKYSKVFRVLTVFCLFVYVLWGGKIGFFNFL